MNQDVELITLKEKDEFEGSEMIRSKDMKTHFHYLPMTF